MEVRYTVAVVRDGRCKIIVAFRLRPGANVRVRHERVRRPAVVLRDTRSGLGLHGRNGAGTSSENTGGRSSHARLSM